jgi:hypothetical protein
MSNENNFYHDTIEVNAQRYGYKAANLMQLESLIQDFEARSEGQRLKELYSGIEIVVPEFCAIDGELIQKHLDNHNSRWRGSFKKFQTSFNAQENKNNLSEDTNLLTAFILLISLSYLISTPNST